MSRCSQEQDQPTVDGQRRKRLVYVGGGPLQQSDRTLEPWMDGRGAVPAVTLAGIERCQ